MWRLCYLCAFVIPVDGIHRGCLDRTAFMLSNVLLAVRI